MALVMAHRVRRRGGLDYKRHAQVCRHLYTSQLGNSRVAVALLCMGDCCESQAHRSVLVLPGLSEAMCRAIVWKSGVQAERHAVKG